MLPSYTVLCFLVFPFLPCRLILHCAVTHALYLHATHYYTPLQFFEHLEEMIIFDTGRGCARAILGELVADHPPRLTPNSAGKRRYGDGNLDLGRKEAVEERERE